MAKTALQKRMDKAENRANLKIYGRAFLLAVLIGRPFESLVFFFSFWTIRAAFPDTFHFRDVQICYKWTQRMLYASVFCLLPLPYTVTVFGGVLIAFICAAALYIIKIKTEQRPKAFDIDNCTEEQLRARITEKYPKLKGDKLEYKIFRGLQHFVYKKEHKEIDINPRQSEKERERMKNKIK